MIARLQPFQAFFNGRLGTPRSVEDAAVSFTILSPEETAAMPPVIIDPEDRTRVTAAQSETTLEYEWRRIDGASVTHTATRRYVFENVLATPFGFYSGGHGFARLGRPPLRQLLTTKITHVKKGFYASSQICMKYFGHWLTDGLPLTLLAREDEELYLPYHTSWDHAPAYIDLLGITRIPENYVVFDEMAFCVDTGQTQNRRDRIRLIRDRVQASVTGNGNRLVYLQRGSNGIRRQIVNEPELLTALEAHGFATVPIDAPLHNILGACHGAEIIVSIEGSQMTHGLFTAAEGALHVTLNPRDRFNNVFADYMPALRSQLGTIVMERAGADYQVDVARVLDFLRRHAPSKLRNL